MSVRHLLASGDHNRLDIHCRSLTTWGSDPKPSLRGYAQLKAGTQSAIIAAGGEQPGTTDLQGRLGWEFIKPLASPVPNTKINWYFYGGTFESLPASHLSSMWSILSIDYFIGTSAGLPWLSVYTKPQGDGNDAELWYRSKTDYHITVDGSVANRVRSGERVCIHTLAAPPSESLNGARKIQLSPATTGPAVLPTDEILYMVMHTNSAAPQASFCVESLAYQTKDGLGSDDVFDLHLVG